MSFNTLDTASKDPGLQNRTIACVQSEAHRNPAVAGSAYAATVTANPAEGVRLVWPVALNTEAEYASALASGVPNPGADESVITDSMILSAVQASWPPDPA
jgi:hypothetical protein